jgi:hypothetical protein
MSKIWYNSFHFLPLSVFLWFCLFPFFVVSVTFMLLCSTECTTYVCCTDLSDIRNERYRTEHNISIAGHRHRRNEQRNRHSGIHNFIPVPDQKMPDCVGLVWYRTCSSIVSFFHSGTRLTGCRTVRHLYTVYTMDMDSSLDTDMQNGHGHGHTAWAYSMDMDMQHVRGHTAWTRTCRMDNDMEMQHEHGHAAWTQTCSMDQNMQHGYRHAAWTWTCSIDKDMGMQHRHGHKSWTQYAE